MDLWNVINNKNNEVYRGFLADKSLAGKAATPYPNLNLQNAKTNSSKESQKSVFDKLSLSSIKSSLKSPPSQIKHLIHICTRKEKRIAENNQKISASTSHDIEQGTTKKATIINELDYKPKAHSSKTIFENAKSAMAAAEQHALYTPSGDEVFTQQINDKIAKDLGDKSCFNVTLSQKTGTISPKKDILFQGVKWKNHTAAAMLDKCGKIHVMDPLVSTEKAVPVAEWMNNFNSSQPLQVRITEKNSTPRDYNIEKDKLLQINHMKEQINLNELKQVMGEHSLLSKNMTPVPKAAYMIDHTSTQTYSFSEKSAKYLSENNLRLNQNTLRLTDSESGQDDSALFKIEHNGKNYDLTPEQLKTELSLRGKEKIEIREIPCVINKNNYKTLETTNLSPGKEVLSAFSWGIDTKQKLHLP